MRIENITSASIFPRLSLILKEDIQILNRAIEGKKDDQGITDLLDSLQYAKTKILSLISLDDIGEFGGSPSAPKKHHLAGYSSSDLDNIDNQVELIDLLLNVETSELEMVKSADVGKGMPDDLHQKLHQILEFYQSITDQLGRTKSTQQLGIINI